MVAFRRGIRSSFQDPLAEEAQHPICTQPLWEGSCGNIKSLAGSGGSLRGLEGSRDTLSGLADFGGRAGGRGECWRQVGEVARSLRRRFFC